MTVVGATDADIPFILRTERLPGYDALVARSDAAGHRARMANQRCAHFIARADDRPVGFAIVRDWHAPDGIALLMRIAMAEPGKGYGTAFLGRILDRVFGETACHRFWVGQFPDNTRARRVYEAVGFVAEGIARGNIYLNGQHRDELILSILRPDWQARRTADRAI